MKLAARKLGKPFDDQNYGRPTMVTITLSVALTDENFIQVCAFLREVSTRQYFTTPTKFLPDSTNNSRREYFHIRDRQPTTTRCDERNNKSPIEYYDEFN